jgi:hypothetical protein
MALRPADNPDATNPPLFVATYHVRRPPMSSFTSSPDEASSIEVPIDVVRDDVLFAGTKQRAACTFVKELIAHRKAATTELLYTAPFNGFGPVAVAHCAQCLQLKCTLILTRRPISQTKSVPLSICETAETVIRAKACGATVLFANTWDDMRTKGMELFQADHGVLWIPVGLSRPGFVDALHHKIVEASESAAIKVGSTWRRMFVAGGTGALGVALSRAFPAVHVHIVPAATDIDARKRIEKTVGDTLLESGRITIVDVSSRLSTDTAPLSTPTPYPTVPGYDELTWDAVVADPQPGDVVWNVAGFTSPKCSGDNQKRDRSP